MVAVASHPATCVWTARASLGEGPLWLADEAALYWVDILAATLCRYTPASGECTRWRMPFPLSALAATVGGDLLCTGPRAVCRFDRATSELSSVWHPELGSRASRINDGACHPDGSFWFGTMDRDEVAPVGDFFRLAPDGGCERFAVARVITNGPAFSPSGHLGYFVDTIGRTVRRTSLAGGDRFDLESFIEIPEADGHPDGLAVDADGGIWCAHWGGARVTRFDADGCMTDVIPLPVAHVTKCAFGGEHLDRLYITTARKDLDDDALRAQPLAGGLFVADVGRRGTDLPAFRGSVREATTGTWTCANESS